MTVGCSHLHVSPELLGVLLKDGTSAKRYNTPKGREDAPARGCSCETQKYVNPPKKSVRLLQLALPFRAWLCRQETSCQILWCWVVNTSESPGRRKNTHLTNLSRHQPRRKGCYQQICSPQIPDRLLHGKGHGNLQ